MNPESDYGMSTVSCGNGKLRSWLIEQVDTGKYPGLVWENEEKSIFRIPWKHAGKQDYNRDEDAALFKVLYDTGPQRNVSQMLHLHTVFVRDVYYTLDQHIGHLVVLVANRTIRLMMSSIRALWVG